MVVSGMIKKLYSVLLLFTPIKKVHVFQKFVGVNNILAINNEKMIMKDYSSKYFLEVKSVVMREKLE